MRIGTNLRTRVTAMFAVLFLFFGITSGIPGLHTESHLTPMIVTAHAAGAATSNTNKGPADLFASNISSALKNTSTDMDSVVSEARDIATTITTILTVISFVCLLYWIAKLAMSAGNPMTRRMALTGILFSGIALALFGGSWVVVSFFWNVLS